MENFEEFKNQLCQWNNHKVRSNFPVVTKEDLIRDGIVIYGASDWGKSVCDDLIVRGIIPDWFVDKNESLYNSKILGVEVREIESLKECHNRYVLIASTHIAQMIEVCKQYEVKWILHSSLYDFCSMNGQYGMLDNRFFDEILEGFSLFSDQKSIEIYKQFIKYHFIFDNDFQAVCDPVGYFPKDLASSINYSHFIDGGAFTGDTLSSWISSIEIGPGNLYYAFEPSMKNFRELTLYYESLPNEMKSLIILNNQALGNKISSFALNDNGLAETRMYEISDCSVVHGSVITSNTIDNLFANKLVTVIKADVEGFEMELLKGAKNTILKQRPVLMISVYHNYYDIWKIPQYIKSLDLNYDIFLRHHNKVFSDTVCYAIAK